METTRISGARRLAPHFLIYSLLVVCHAAMAVAMRYPTVMYDELVYAGFARYFSGTASMPNLYGGVYGHFGYSLLIAPLFLVQRTFAGQYHAILLLNGLVLSAVYFPLYGLGKRFFETPRGVTMAAAGITALYPPFLLYGNFVLAENLFIPLYLVAALLLVRWLERPSMGRALAAGLTAPLLYVVHTRGIGVVLCAAAVAVAAGWRKKVPLRESLAVVSACAAGVAAMEFFKGRIDLWSAAVMFQDRKVPIGLYTINDVKLVILAATGQILYLVQSTMGLYLLGLAGLVRALGSKREAVRGGAAFLLASQAVVVAGAAFFASRIDPLSRLDILFLGRYGEGVLAPWMLAGLLFTYDAARAGDWQNWFRQTVTGTVALVAAGVVFLSRYIEVSTRSLLAGQLHINSIGLVGPAVLLPRREVELLCVASACVLMGYAAVAKRSPMAAYGLITAVFAACTTAAFLGAVMPGQRLTEFNATAATPARLVPVLGAIPPGAVAYDAAVWDAFTFAEYQLYAPHLRFEMFDSRTAARPCCDVAVASRRWAGAGYAAVGGEELSDNTLWVRSPQLAQRLAGRQSYIGLEVGSRGIGGVATAGVYAEERWEGGEFRWTNGHATIEVPLQPGDAPKRLELMLGAFSATPVEVRVNGSVVAAETLQDGATPVKRPLSGTSGRRTVAIAIDSGTFTPAPAGGSTRTLGVQIRSLRVF